MLPVLKKLFIPKEFEMKREFFIRWNLDLDPKVVEWFDGEILDLTQAREVLKKFQLS
jgi:hypothetical protein